MVSIHAVVKFWARKSPAIIEAIMPKRAKYVLDPFCGSGTTGYAGVLRRVNKIVLSDINPVAVFVAENILDKRILDEKIYREVVELCKEIEKETYTITYNGKIYTVQKAAWLTKYECPYCGEVVSPIEHKDPKSKKLLCPRCKNKFYSLNASIASEEVFEIHVYNNGKKRIITSSRVLEEYCNSSETYYPRDWYPKDEFVYPDGTPFIQHPRKIRFIYELFTRRGLYASSKLYAAIEEIWKENPSQGDLLKLAFIASLFAATKMLPYSKTSGTSWKVPRYWIPHIRYEKNFCKTFIHKLELLRNFKIEWYAHVKNYEIVVDYEGNIPNGDIINKQEDTIIITKSDARTLEIESKFDFILMDPPHFSEINYFELTFLWNVWLRGHYNDKRFTDVDFWKKEIDVNPRLGRDTYAYIDELFNIVKKYFKMLNKDGKLVLIMHATNYAFLKSLIKKLEEELFSVTVKKVYTRIPSSTQGIHGRKKRKLYLIKIKK